MKKNKNSFNGAKENSEEFVDLADAVKEYKQKGAQKPANEAAGADKKTEMNSNANSKKQKKRWSSKKKAIVFSILGVLVVAIGAGIIYVMDILTNPLGQFDTIKEQFEVSEPGDEQSLEVQEDLLTVDGSVAGTQLSALESLEGMADMSILENLDDGIINVMLIGVDYSDERITEEWIDGGNGKTDFHSDVMMVLAFNIEEGTVDMLSMPRDTYVNVPGVEGYYKMNASLNCGGVFPEPSSLEKVCETAEWMLGGIPVDYYYAVTMPAVKELVDDTVGQVQFDLEMEYSMGDRDYEPGLQMLDGQGVLDYLRVRKNIEESGDLNRIDRQKEMLITIFETMQEQGIIAQIPAILEAFEGDLVTNTTLAQTAALASFAYGLDSENIRMHSFDGTTSLMFDDWVYVFTDQEERVELIEQVYGVTVPEHTDYTYSAAATEWSAAIKGSWASKSQAMLDADTALLAANGFNPDHTLINPDSGTSPAPGETSAPTNTPMPIPVPKEEDSENLEDPETLPVPVSMAMNTPAQVLGANTSFSSEVSPDPVVTLPEGCMTLEERQTLASLISQVNSTEPSSECLKACNSLKSYASGIAERIGYSISWGVGITNDNEVEIDFR